MEDLRDQKIETPPFRIFLEHFCISRYIIKLYIFYLISRDESRPLPALAGAKRIFKRAISRAKSTHGAPLSLLRPLRTHLVWLSAEQTIEVSTQQSVPAIWTGQGKLYINCAIIRSASSTAKAWPNGVTHDVSVMAGQGLSSERYSWEDIREEVEASFKDAVTTRIDTQSIKRHFWLWS